MPSSYPFAVNRLLSIGQPSPHGQWLDYSQYGISNEHAPDLLRLIDDPQFNEEGKKTNAIYGPIHAWRALGQLKDESLRTQLFSRMVQACGSNDDWFCEDFPNLMALYGPPQMPEIETHLASVAEDDRMRMSLPAALQRLAEEFPETRAECVAILTRQLAQADKEDSGVNAMIVSALIDLNAVETAPVIETAFEKNAVDESIVGDWLDVRYDLGVGPPPPNRRTFIEPLPSGYRAHSGSNARERAKARRKKAKADRKRQRRKK